MSSEAFLLQEIQSASPSKLRWLLLQKAHGLSRVVEEHWQRGQVTQAKQWVIWIQDIMTELLEGIVDPKHELAKQQSDLYVFLTKLLAVADQTNDQPTLRNFIEILEIEMETWDMLSRRTLANENHATISSMDTTGEYTPFSMEA
jgi:flagellin-specific chaperone FliS